MQREISNVIPATSEIGGLFLGSLKGAKSVRLMKQRGIDTVFTVAAQTGLSYHFADKMTHHIYNAYDSPLFNFFPFFDEIVDKIHGYRTKGHTCYVHCFMGISRACTITCCYLMKYENMKFEQALDLVRNQRPIVYPNQGFIKQMKKYQITLSKRNKTTEKNNEKPEKQDKQEKQEQINDFLKIKKKPVTVETLKRYSSLQKSIRQK